MMRQRRGQPLEAESSSDEEDAFAKLSSRKKGEMDEKGAQSSNTKTTTGSYPIFANPDNGNDAGKEAGKQPQKPKMLPASTTSSMKRHHLGGSNDSRKARMDALLQELEAEKSRRPSSQDRNFVPEKKGSFVDPDEEHLTTNLFVGTPYLLLTKYA